MLLSSLLLTNNTTGVERMFTAERKWLQNDRLQVVIHSVSKYVIELERR